MSETDYDLIVLGAGSGGLASAKRAASYGAKVAIVENDRVGGTCVIRGCVPKKLMVYAAEFGHAIEDAAGYGWNVPAGATHDWERLVAARDANVDGLERTHERLLAEAGVELLRGSARVAGPTTVAVGDRRLQAAKILIATGAAPVLPAVDGIEHAITSDEIFSMARRPDHVVVVGSGYIGCEFAGIFAGLGARVTQLIRRETPLTGFDEDIRSALLDALRASGVDVRTQTTVDRIEHRGDGVRLALTTAGRADSVEADCALVYAVGRDPRTQGLGLEEVGVELGRKGEVLCDEQGRTAVETVFAVGDVTGRAALTPVAIQAGRAFADRVFGGKPALMSYDNIPSAVFTSPPIGSVGLTEAQAVARYGRDAITVYKSSFTPMIYSLTERKERTTVKLITAGAEETVVGCHLIGHDAAEIIQGFGVAVKMGATKADFDATVGIHPSTAEELVTLT